jgi:hypothetical protein
MAKIGYCHLCLREESKKTKGPKQDGQNRLLSPMHYGGELHFPTYFHSDFAAAHFNSV